MRRSSSASSFEVLPCCGTQFGAPALKQAGVKFETFNADGPDSALFAGVVQSIWSFHRSSWWYGPEHWLSSNCIRYSASRSAAAGRDGVRGEDRYG